MGKPRARRRTPSWWAAAGLAAAVVAGCAQAPQVETDGTAATFRYTCCSTADVEQVLHPGDVLVVHWIVETLPPTRSYPEAPVTLSASLSGSFSDVAQLKGSVGTDASSQQVAATPVQTTNKAGGAPVSTIAIPPGAAPGLYNLTTSVESEGGKLTGATIVRVAARAAS